MNEEEVKALILMINAGMKVLSMRVVLLLTLLLTAALFAWCLYLPGPYRLGAAAAFAVLVFLPVIRRESKERKESP